MSVFGSRIRRDRAVPADPLAAAHPDFFLPDRNDLLEAVDGVVAGGESLSSMLRGNRYRHRRLTQLDPSHPVPDCEAVRVPPMTDLVCDLAHLSDRHLRIGLIFEVAHFT